MERVQIRDLLPALSQALKPVAGPRATKEARLLLCHLLGLDEVSLIRDDTLELSESQLREVQALLERRVKDEPMAYLLGEKEFLGRRFKVSPSVLIPRPETELLVEEILLWIQKNKLRSGRILDLGTGSGVIACSLVAELRRAFEVIGVDVSEQALELAAENQRTLNLGAIVWKRLDLLEAEANLLFWEDFDVIVSNPPYIPSAELETLAPSIRDYEPRVALDGGPEGMKFYEKIVEVWWKKLRPGGLLALETQDQTQRQKIRNLWGDLNLKIWTRDCHLFAEKPKELEGAASIGD